MKDAIRPPNKPPWQHRRSRHLLAELRLPFLVKQLHLLMQAVLPASAGIITLVNELSRRHTNLTRTRLHAEASWLVAMRCASHKHSRQRLRLPDLLPERSSEKAENGRCMILPCSWKPLPVAAKQQALHLKSSKALSWLHPSETSETGMWCQPECEGDEGRSATLCQYRSSSQLR